VDSHFAAEFSNRVLRLLILQSAKVPHSARLLRGRTKTAQVGMGNDEIVQRVFVSIIEL
jgi:hypothetical protein